MFPEPLERLREGDPVARVVNLFGEIVGEYQAPHKGIVIGKTIDPVAPIGTRIMHFGRLANWEDHST